MSLLLTLHAKRDGVISALRQRYLRRWNTCAATLPAEEFIRSAPKPTVLSERELIALCASIRAGFDADEARRTKAAA